ncbi:MAG: lipopolysaccharide assembly protein LapA domain-containing protein [Weeksellaceae bacterium]
MFTFILYIVLAIIFGYFATQNTDPVSVTLMGATLSQIPLYLILGVTLLVGLAFSWFISLFDTLAATMKIQGKEHVIKDSKATINDLEKKIARLEVENARLTGEIKGTTKSL